MINNPLSLSFIFEGWEGYQTSIVHAVAPLASSQLAWRPSPQLRSVGETAGHLALGRIGWFSRMNAPGSQELLKRAEPLMAPGGNIDPSLASDVNVLIAWLTDTWAMIATTLDQWELADLTKTYRHSYWGKVYSVSYQWTFWRILSHDIHHGGEIALMLGMQGIEVPELGDLGGHLTEPPLAGVN